jgi:hypothetical protein
MEEPDDFDDVDYEKIALLYTGEEYPNLDPLIVDQLRQAATAGQSTSQLLAYLQTLIGFGRTSRSTAREYFEAAFVWTFGEALRLGGWSYFDGSAWTDEMVDNHYAALLNEWRTNPRKVIEAK